MSTLDKMNECFERSSNTCCDLTAEGTRSRCVRLNDNVTDSDFKEAWEKVEEFKGNMSAEEALEKFKVTRCVLNEGGWEGSGGYLDRFPNLSTNTSDDKCMKAYVCKKISPGYPGREKICRLTNRQYYKDPSKKDLSSPCSQCLLMSG